MSYDFPSSPTPGQEYIPPMGGQTYIWQPPRWLVKGSPPAGGGGGSGIEEAPVDGAQYARKSAAWAVVSSSVAVSWTDVTGKPATFTPTLPIPSAGVTGLDGKQTSQDADIATKLNASAYTAADVRNKLLTIDGHSSGIDADLLDGQEGFYYTDRANHVGTQPENSITNLVSDLALKAPLASPTFTGNPTAPTAVMTTNTTQIATTQFVQANMVLKEPALPTGGTTSTWLRGDKSWQTLPPSGISDAPADGKQYVRVNNAWVEVFIPPPPATPFIFDVNGDAVVKIGTSIVVRIKPSGLILTKDDIEVFSVSV
jgi:hypothetical protein